MSKRTARNGTSQVRIHIERPSPGYAIFHSEPIDDNTPLYLSHSLETWVMANPRMRVRASVPLAKDGNTVCLHVFFDGVEEPLPPPDASPTVD